MIQCFMVYATNRFKLCMRRYVSTADKCPVYGYHNGQSTWLEVVEVQPREDGVYWDLAKFDDLWPHDDPRWPTKCDHCPHVFSDGDAWQVFSDHIYVDDAGKEYSLRDSTPGMMHYADWMGEWAKGPDGHAVHVVCPDGRGWLIDGPASNCTMPQDRGPFGQAHRCWVRHGTPPLISVDKNGRTCAAGAGSIDTKHQYHGFLGTNGAQPGWFT